MEKNRNRRISTASEVAERCRHFLESIADKPEFDQRPHKSGARLSSDDQGQQSASLSGENISKSNTAAAETKTTNSADSWPNVSAQNRGFFGRQCSTEQAKKIRPAITKMRIVFQSC